MTLQRRALNDGSEGAAPPLVHDVLRSPGQSLDRDTRSLMETHFGHDFSQVRVHADGKAAESAHAVRASAYTVGEHVVFGAGRHEPATAAGRELLAHELTHVVQQRGTPSTSTLRVGRAADPCEAEAEAMASAVTGAGGIEIAQQASGLVQRQQQGPSGTNSGASTGASRGAGSAGGASTTPKPETCPAPPDLPCTPTKAAVSGVSNTLVFPADSAVLNALQKAEIDRAAATWRSRGATGNIRVDGYASPEYECLYNWRLSCRRALAVAAELEHPSDHSPGVPAPNISLFAHGESDEAGPALAPNRRVTLSLPAAPVPPSPAPTCALPRSLGVGRTLCGSTPDFGHFDFPSISAASEIKLSAWAALHGAIAPPLIPPIGRWYRNQVSDFACEVEMDGVLVGFAGATGHHAFSRFSAGTGGTETHGPASTLGHDALISGSFARTLAAVKKSIEGQLASQAASGRLDPCALSVVPPPTHFGVSDGRTLKAVIGGTHGERLNATAFTGDIPTRTYSIGLEFLICDNFGVDEADLYAPGLFGFWVLQHERSATLFAPFINLLDLPVTVSGTF